MFRSFAIVPAAGRSERMGSPKLLLPLGDRTVIEHVLGAWTSSAVTATVVVARADDEALLERCRQFRVELATPVEAPVDMKASVQLGLAHIQAKFAPAESDAWLVAPADLPGLAPQVIDAVLAAYDPKHPTGVVPAYRDQRGHPTLLPWAIADEIRKLEAHEGINALVARTRMVEIALGRDGILPDLDLPSDYSRLAQKWKPAADGETATVRPVF